MVRINLGDYKGIFIGMGLIAIILFALPTLALFIQPPSPQEFNEIYIVGRDHDFKSLPFNVVAANRYLLYLGVANQQGFSSYYTVYVKLGNQNDSLPNLEKETPSSLQPLYEYNFMLEKGATWQTLFTFQFNNIIFNTNASSISSINFNGLPYSVTKALNWNFDKSGYGCNFIFELWVYNPSLGILEYNHRFVILKLNLNE